MAKKSGKLKKSEILVSSRGVTLAKMNQSHQKVNWNSNSSLQSNRPSFNPTAAKMAKKKKKVP
jgi:TRAP-type mannitol/chloroaromatic compound transport system substrate-binding protein